MIRARAFVLALSALSLHGLVQAQEVTDCDRLAAHPDDPRGIAPGVADGEIDTAAAHPACVGSLEAAPDTPRLQFQLGRVHWQADRDAEAVEMFSRAATEGAYPAAFAFLGIAHEYGYTGDGPDPDMARTLYRAALAGGFEPAQGLLDGLADATPLDPEESEADAPDFDGFYQSAYLDALYHHRFDELNADSLKVVIYLKGMYDFFQQEVNWYDLRCAHLHDTRMTQKIVRDLFGSSPNVVDANAETIFGRILDMVAEGSAGGAGELISLALEMPILVDEGKRDAGHLVTQYRDDMGYYCEADAIKRLYKNAQYYFLEEMRF